MRTVAGFIVGVVGPAVILVWFIVWFVPQLVRTGF